MRIPVLLVALLAACESYTEVPGPTPFGATLAAVSNVTTNGSGVLTASLHPYNEAISYTLTWTGLGSAATSAHIHGPATGTGTAGILVDFATLPTGSAGTIDLAGGLATGGLDLTGAITPTVTGDSLLTLLNRGQLYVDVHSVGQGGGEIRGAIARR